MAIRVCFFVYTASILVLSLPACGSDDDQPIEGCAKLMENCIDEPHFNDLGASGVVSIPSCEDFFRCALDFYSGDCLSDLEDILYCVSGTERAGCVACDESFGEFMHSCPAPETCYP